jgi:hypothetical protein
MRKPRTLRRLTIRRAGFRQRDILKAAGAAAIELLFARSAPRLGAGGAGVGPFGHAPTGRGTILSFRSKFLALDQAFGHPPTPGGDHFAFNSKFLLGPCGNACRPTYKGG